METWILKIHLFATIFMVGLVWFVQLLHYPLFHQVSLENFQGYHQRYLRESGFLIAPVMLVEVISGSVLVFLKADLLLILNMTFLALIWLSTFLLQVPFHNRLGEQRNEQIIRKLVNSNWLRTVLWSVRGLLLLYLL